MRLVAIGTIPVVIVGLLFADWIEAHARLPMVTVVTLTVGAIGLLLVERLGPRTRGVDDLTPVDAAAFGAGPGRGADPRAVALGQHDHGRHAARRAARRRGPVHVPARAFPRWWPRRARRASSCGTSP